MRRRRRAQAMAEFMIVMPFFAAIMITALDILPILSARASVFEIAMANVDAAGQYRAPLYRYSSGISDSEAERLQRQHLCQQLWVQTRDLVGAWMPVPPIGTTLESVPGCLGQAYASSGDPRAGTGCGPLEPALSASETSVNRIVIEACLLRAFTDNPYVDDVPDVSVGRYPLRWDVDNTVPYGETGAVRYFRVCTAYHWTPRMGVLWLFTDGLNNQQYWPQFYDLIFCGRGVIDARQSR